MGCRQLQFMHGLFAFLQGCLQLQLLHGSALQAFLEENGLRLIIRSHEGPDARWKRDDMHDMTYGYTFDHIIEGGGPMPSAPAASNAMSS